MSEAALAEAFEDVGVTWTSLAREVVAELASLAVLNDLSETKLARLWEAYAMQPGVNTQTSVPAAHMARFAAYIKAQNAGSEADEPAPVFARTPAFAPAAKTAAARTPAPAAPTPMAVQQAPSASAFSARGARMQAAPALNGHLPEAAPAPAGDAARCGVALVGPDPAALGERFMRERLEDRVDYIEGRLLSFASAAAGASGGRAFEDALHAASGVRVSCVGRVVCEGEGRLNEASVLLEGSAKHSAGSRVRLELRDLPRFALFPGQAVAVEGANPSGFCLVARRLLSGAPGPRSAEAQAAASAASPAFSVVVAAGPFTCAGDLSYEPLAELLSYCADKRPDLLLLVGPFVDAEHALVAGGTLDESFDQLFDTRCRDALLAYCDAAGGACRVALLPSTRDAAAQPVFPQPPLPRQLFDDAPAPGQVLCAPNPAVLRVGGLDLAASAADVLKALSGAEAARGGAPNEDRLARLASHVIGQRSFFPLFPPPLGSMLDAKRAQEGLALPHAPHLLILPSDLAPFAKLLPGGPSVAEAPPRPEDAAAAAEEAEGGDAAMADAAPAGAAVEQQQSDTSTVCVNPGRLARGSLGGTFAHIHVAAGCGALEERVRVDIIRV